MAHSDEKYELRKASTSASTSEDQPGYGSTDTLVRNEVSNKQRETTVKKERIVSLSEFPFIVQQSCVWFGLHAIFKALHRRFQIIVNKLEGFSPVRLRVCHDYTL